MVLKRLLPAFIITFIMLVLAPLSFAEGPVWKVSKGGHHLFIGGTIHLLGENDYPLPSVFDQAYLEAEILVFEIDPDMAKSPEAQKKFLIHSSYQDGRTLKKVLNEDTYILLNNFLAVRGMSIESFNTIKPGMLSVVLTVVELQRLGLAGMGVDEFYSEKAKKDGKQRQYLENIDDQFAALANLGEGKENEVIIHSLDELERLSSVMEDMKHVWRKGDNQALIDIALSPWVEKFPHMYDDLLVKRNQRWLPQIEAFLRTAEVEYVLVGALHLAGPDGVLAMLKEKGYRVKRL